MLKQFIVKQRKLLKGIYYTHVKRNGKVYDEKAFWDNSFYTEGVSDSKTLSQNKSQLSSFYHYASVEMILLRDFFNNQRFFQGKKVLDLGSGSGHWIEFYRKLDTSEINGIDVAKSSVDYLNAKYESNNQITIHHGSVDKIIEELNEKFDIINAIGVMFHIVDDKQWKKTIQVVSNSLAENGVFIIGGHFGILNKINVQRDKNNYVNKRLRSRLFWKRSLRKAGFKKIKFYRNPGYLKIKDTLPENNILIATK